jgi:hypothetical protein
MTLREQLLAAPSTPAGDFTLTGSGVKVFLRRWPLGDRLRVLAISAEQERSWRERQVELLALCLAEANNERMFPDGDAAIHLPAFGADVDAIIEQALAANGLTQKKAPPTDTPTS